LLKVIYKINKENKIDYILILIFITIDTNTLSKNIDEYITRHSKLETKIDNIISSYFTSLPILYNVKHKCNCEIYSPFIVNGPCRFCYK